MPDPANATLAEAIAHLRSRFGWLLDDFVRGRLVVWTGAKISEGKLPALDGLLKSLLDGIHSRINHSNPTCIYRLWLAGKILPALHGPIGDAPSAWPEIRKIIDDFWLRYATLLDDDLNDGGTVVSLIWDILKIHEMYAPHNPDPDAEHRFLALLMAERVVEQSVTTNWDDLVETAFDRASGTRANRHLSVIVHRHDLAEPTPASSLFKIHGCARRARNDFGNFSTYIVATHTQFTDWISDQEREAIRQRLTGIVSGHSVIFVGSSAQDRNLQERFGEVIKLVDPPPIDPPKFVFSSASLEEPHRQVLRAIHHTDFTLNETHFEQSAVLGLYGKPLLGSLYVLTLIRKAEAITDVASGELGSWTGDLRRGIELFERRLCEWFDNLSHGSPEEKWRELSRFLPALVSRFRSLREHAEVPGSEEEYHEFWNENVGEILQGSHPLGTKLHRVLLTLSVLMLGDEARHWVTSVAQSAAVTAGQFHIQAGSRSLAVFCLDNDSESWGRATQQGLIDEAVQPDVAVIYPSGSEPKDRPRYGTPAAGHSLPTRSRPLGPTQIWMDDEREASADLDALLASLQTQLKA
jgi:hypothetical protein